MDERVASRSSHVVRGSSETPHTAMPSPEQVQRIKRLFSLAADLPPEERSGFLDRHCGTDDALCERLSNMLTELDEDRGFLETPLSLEGERDPVEPPGPEGAPGIPERVGRYRILERIGEGGMGSVYLAEQEEPVRRRVAVKILHMGLDSAKLVARFEAERGALARIDHVNVAHWYDAGATETGRPYFVMEYVPGVSITRYCDERRLSVGDRLELFVQVCDALQHAHQKGIVHRDVKPSNVLVTDQDGRAVPKVIDFGIARLTDDESVSRMKLTRTGQVVGTLEYMSPEQADPAGRDIDSRADIYSLGGLLYELLTGVLPFDWEALGQEPFWEQQRVLCEEKPERPSTRFGRRDERERSAQKRRTDARTLTRQVRGDLDWIALKALETDPERRYPSASELAEDVRRHLESQPVLARKPSRIYYLRKFVRRNRAVVTVASLGLILALGLAVGFLGQMRRDLRHTRALALASASAEVAGKNPTLSLLLAREAMGLEPSSSEALSALQRALSAHRERAVLRHDGKVNAACFSKDGRHILTVSADRTAKLWDGDGAYLRSLEHPAPVLCGAFSPDGTMIVTGCEEGVVRLWAIGGVLVAELEGHTEAVLTAEFAPNGLSVLTGSADGTALRWSLDGKDPIKFKHGARLSVATFSPDGERVLTADGWRSNLPKPDVDFVFMGRLWTKSGEPFADLEGHTDSIVSATFSEDGDWIVTASPDETARLWDKDGRFLRLLPHPGEAVIGATFQVLDGATRILTADSDGVVWIWDLEGKIVRTPYKHRGAARSPVASRNGDRILSSSADQTAVLLDGDGALITEFIGHTHSVGDASFSPDETRVLTYSDDHTARLWDVEIEELPVLRGHTNRVSGAVFSRDRERILSTSHDGTIRLWTSSGERIRTFEGHGSGVLSASFSPDEDTIVSASWDGEVRLWETETGDYSVLAKHPAGFWDAEFSPDGLIVATCPGDGTATLLDVKSGTEVSPLDPPGTPGARGLAFSPNGKLIVIAYFDQMARIWDVAEEEVIQRLEGRVARVAFSPDGEHVATASGDGTARIWNLDGSVRAICKGHQGAVLNCAFSPDGRTLATTSRDGTVRIWDLDGPPSSEQPPWAARELAVLDGQGGITWGVSFSTDGTRLLTTSEDRTVRTWIIDTTELLELAEKRLAPLEDYYEAELGRFGDLLGR